MILPNNPSLEFLLSLTEEQILGFSPYNLGRFISRCENEEKEIKRGINKNLFDAESSTVEKLHKIMEALDNKANFANNIINANKP